MDQVYYCTVCGRAISLKEIERVGRYVKDESHPFYSGCCSEECLRKQKRENNQTW